MCQNLKRNKKKGKEKENYLWDVLKGRIGFQVVFKNDLRQLVKVMFLLEYLVGGVNCYKRRGLSKKVGWFLKGFGDQVLWQIEDRDRIKEIE